MGPQGLAKRCCAPALFGAFKKTIQVVWLVFFCTSDDATKRQPLAIVRSWVAQMARQNPIALEVAEDYYRGRDERPPTTQDIWQLFGEICRQLANCFLIVDGFDECMKTTQSDKVPTHDGGARFFRDLRDASIMTSAHILFISKEDVDVRGHFRKLVESNPGSVVEHEILLTDTEVDLQAYSATVVGDNLSKKPSELQDEIAEEASRRSQGMFLWVRILGNRLNIGKNAKQLREIVKETPAGLEKQYERDMQRINDLKDERDRANAILRWTLFAQRPLTVRELTEALAIDLDDNSRAFPTENLPDTWGEDEVNDEIRRLCGSLIELRSDDVKGLSQDQTVHLVHSSVREYLIQSARYNTEQVAGLSFQAQNVEEDLLAQICLRYLMCEEVGSYLATKDGIFCGGANEYKFLEYAVQS